VRRGDIVLVDLEPVRGAEADKARPAVLVGNDASIQAAARHGRGVLTIVPLTTNTTIRGRMHVALRPTRLNGLSAPSKAQAEQVRSIDIERVHGRLGRLGPTDLAALDDALRYHLAIS
jgi:mRNA interferase MazF